MGSVYLPGTSGIKGSYFSSLFLVFSLSLSGFHLLVWMSPMPSSLQCFSFKLTFFSQDSHRPSVNGQASGREIECKAVKEKSCEEQTAAEASQPSKFVHGRMCTGK